MLTSLKLSLWTVVCPVSLTLFRVVTTFAQQPTALVCYSSVWADQHGYVDFPQTFISKEHEKQSYGEGTPGPSTAQPYDSYGKQSLSTRSTSPGWGFGTSRVSGWLRFSIQSMTDVRSKQQAGHTVLGACACMGEGSRSGSAWPDSASVATIHACACVAHHGRLALQHAVHHTCLATCMQ